MGHTLSVSTQAVLSKGTGTPLYVEAVCECGQFTLRGQHRLSTVELAFDTHLKLVAPQQPERTMPVSQVLLGAMVLFKR